MSAISDALTALKNVVLLQERQQRLEKDVESLSDDVDGLSDYVTAVDKRVIRIETMVEIYAGTGGQTPPQIEQ